jgi:cephalosporin hydroxylase
LDLFKEHQLQVEKNIAGLSADKDVQGLSRIWSRETNRNGYAYNFSWLSRPIIQYPQDIVAIQEIIWEVKPDLIIETGIAHGGSLIFSASMLTLLDYYDAAKKGVNLNPAEPKRTVIGIDIEIRAHNQEAIEAHPMFNRIQMIEGSSVAPQVIEQIHAIAKENKCVLVFLDSMHTHDHVLAELEAYAPLVTPGSYCVVFDTLIEDMPDNMFSDRPWSKGNNPKTAVWEYLKRLKENGRKGVDGKPLNYKIDKTIEHKLLITVAPDGYLRRF